MNVGNQLREAAAQYCSMNAAFFAATALKLDPPDPWDQVDALVRELSWATYRATHNNLEQSSVGSAERWAEAEALLRTGWNPPCAESELGRWMP